LEKTNKRDWLIIDVYGPRAQALNYLLLLTYKMEPQNKIAFAEQLHLNIFSLQYAICFPPLKKGENGQQE